MQVRLVYYSRASHWMGPCERAALAEACRVGNLARGISGGLVLYRDVFMQVVEGQRDAVTDLFERVLWDPRHHAVTLVELAPSRSAPLPGVWMAQLDEPDVVEDLLATRHRPPPFDPSSLGAEAMTRLVNDACSARCCLVD